MAQDDAFVGIDVAKHELVIYLHPQAICWRVDNTPMGRAKLVRRLRRLAATHVLRIGFEASGGYERRLAILLESKGLAGYLLDPSRVHSFGRAEGRLAKTDPLDAALIARTLAALHGDLVPYRHDPLAERLTERVRIRELALRQAGQLANQLESLTDPVMRRIIIAQTARLKALILRLEAIITSLIASCPDLARREKLLRFPRPGLARSWRQHCWRTCPNSAPCRPAKSPVSPAWHPQAAKAAPRANQDDVKPGDPLSAEPSIWPRYQSSDPNSPSPVSPTGSKKKENQPKSPSSLPPANCSSR